MFGRRQPDANHGAGDFLGQQLPHAALDAGRVGGLAALAAAGVLALDEDGLSAGAKGVEFFLEPELGDHAGDTAGANLPAGLAQFLGDHVGRGIGVEEAVADHLAQHLVAAAVVGLGAALVAFQGAAAALKIGLQQLVVALFAVAVFAGGAGGAEALALAFEQHGELAGDVVAGQHRQGTLGADDAAAGMIHFEHGEASFGRGWSDAGKVAQGRGVS